MSAGRDGVSDGVPVTVLFCGVAGVAGLVEAYGSGWSGVLEVFQALVSAAVEGCDGHVEDGDDAVVFGSFLDASAAVRAAGLIERELGGTSWPGLRVEGCVGLHAGVVGDGLFLMGEDGETRLVGLDVHRGARVMAAANAGQVLVTDAVRGLLAGEESDRLEDLGFHRLGDFPESVRLFHLVVDENHHAGAFAPPKTLDFRPTNLTADDRPLLGRDELIESVRSAFLSDHRRLVTLTGPGGVGKTRVAIAVGSELLEEHRGGVWLIRAETLTRADELLAAVAVVLSVPDVPGRSLVDALVDRLHAAPVLLIVDNLEQLAGVGEVLSELVARTVSLRVLATSQAPLRVSSEAVVTVPVLARADAVELFSLVARSVQKPLDFSDPEVKTTAEKLIARLDYLPLAIELAAAQLRSSTLRELSEGLESQLELRLTHTGKPERQQSLQAIIDWSVRALPPEAKRLFTRLGVFTGPTTLELIEEICGQDINVLEATATLTDFSLLRRADSGFGMPPAIQLTAAQKLTDSPEESSLKRLHAEAMAKRAHGFSDVNQIQLSSIQEATLINGNFIPAVDWARSSDLELYCKLVTDLSAWWGLTGRNKRALTELSDALGIDGVSDLMRERLLRARGQAFTRVAIHDKAIADVEAALTLPAATEETERGRLLTIRSHAQAWSDPRQAASSAALAVESFREGGVTGRVVATLSYQAQALIKVGDLGGAGLVLEEARELAQLPENHEAVFALGGLSNTQGDWALARDQPLQALRFYASALSIDEWSRTLQFYDSAGIIVSLAQLKKFAAATELTTALETATGELGYAYDRLSLVDDWPDGIVRIAYNSLSEAEFSQAKARGAKISGGQLSARSLAIANEVLKANGIEPVPLSTRSISMV